MQVALGISWSLYLSQSPYHPVTNYMSLPNKGRLNGGRVV